MQTNARLFYPLLAVIGIMLTGCATSQIKEEVLMPPKDTGGVLVKSVTVRPFSSNSRGFGEQLSREIVGRLLKEGHIQVSDQSAETTLTGELVLTRPTTNSWRESSEVKVKENKKKVKKTVYTYYFRKQVTTKASYFLNKGSRIIASNTFTDSFDETWSGSSASEAQAEAKSDDQIMLEQITALAGPIVSAISPHKEVWSFELQGGTDGLSRGIQYYKEGLYSQADAYWKQVADQSSSIEEKAAANYNLGVLKVHEKQYQAAFAKFREADRLQPANRVYMEALRAVEVAEIGRKSLEVEKSMTKSANETGSKSDKRSKKRK